MMDAGINVWVSFIYMSSQNPFIFLSPVPNDYPIML